MSPSMMWRDSFFLLLGSQICAGSWLVVGWCLPTYYGERGFYYDQAICAVEALIL